MRCKMIVILLGFGMLCATGCPPDLQNACYTNDECIEGHLCNKDNQCVEVEQKEMEILVETLDDAVVGKEYSYALSVKGGLKPYTWSVEPGPAWMTTKENSQTHVWRLSGIPTEYQADAVAVKVKVTDNSLDEQSVTKDLSINVLYCSQSEAQGEACSGYGTCNDEGKCECDEAYAGNQCELCDKANGYERNAQQKCVRYEYQCSGGDCGSDFMVRECPDEDCLGVEWTVYDECTTNEICAPGQDGLACIDCGAFGCDGGMCQGCETSDPCCDGTGLILPDGTECASWIEYRCTEPVCGGVGEERDMVRKCDGKVSLCESEPEVLIDWTSIVGYDCDDDQLCVTDGIEHPSCDTCEHGCDNGVACWPECNPFSEGCCTYDGTAIDACWFDIMMNLAWQDPPFFELKNWDEAKTACDNLVMGNRSDWRLPTISELRSLIRGCSQTQVTQSTTGECRVLDDDCLESTCYDYYECGGCLDNKGPGQDGCYWSSDLQGTCGWYWSSSLMSDYPESYVWTLRFTDAFVQSSGFLFQKYIRCVRDGP